MQLGEKKGVLIEEVGAGCEKWERVVKSGSGL
jgi:hypothetical protein